MKSSPTADGSIAVDLLHVLQRRWKASLSFFLICMAMVVAILIIVPRKYESEGIFYVRIGRGGMSLDPTATTSKQVNVQESQQTEINSISAILASRGLLERVVDKLGTDQVLETGANWFTDLTSHLPTLPSLGKASNQESVDDGQDYENLQRREKAVRMLLTDVRVKPTRKAATISISCRAATPKLARDIAKTIMAEYLDVHLRANRTEGAYDFFNDQFAVQEKAVEDKLKEIREFKDRNKITTIEGEQQSLQLQIDELNRRIIESNSQLAAADRRVTVLQSDYQALDDRLITEEVNGNPHEGSDLMRDRLYALQIQEKDLLAKFTPEHPRVTMVRDQLKQARDVYAGQPEDRKQVTMAFNPTKLKLQTNLLNSSADQGSVAAQLDNLVEKRATILSQLEEVNRKEAALARLNRELETAQLNYRTYAEKREEARISRALDMERISNVKVVQEPGLILKPAAPKRLLILLSSAVAIFAASVLLAQILDANDPVVRSKADAEEYLRIPVVANLSTTQASLSVDREAAEPTSTR